MNIMMDKQTKLTIYEDVNSAINYFFQDIKSILKDHFIGMYITGSLALGDFNSDSSDIDFIVITDTSISNNLFEKLKDMHSEFAASNSPWANKIDAVYVTISALNKKDLPSSLYPQVEHGTELFKNVLGDGWVFQRYTLRQCGIIVYGCEPRSIINPIDTQDMTLAVKTIAERWLKAANSDSSWLDWLRKREWQIFVIQTLCHMLYSLSTGSVVSKPAAIKWAQQELKSWNLFITQSISKQNESDISQSDLSKTIDFIKYTVERAHLTFLT